MSLANEIVFAIVAFLILMMGIIFFVVLYQRRMFHHHLELKKINEQKQKELLQASIQGEEDERMRIASELHDDVGASLSSVRLFLHSAAKTSDPEIINRSRELLEDSIQKVRSISHKLQPSMLQHLGLKATLEAMAETVNKSGNLHMTCTLAQIPELDENTGLAVYRVVQELLNNVIKHSGARSVSLSAQLLQDAIVLHFAHDGIGLTEEEFQKQVRKPGAIGLKNIVNRLQSINASIQFEQVLENHYRAVISVPLNS